MIRMLSNKITDERRRSMVIGKHTDTVIESKCHNANRTEKKKDTP